MVREASSNNKNIGWLWVVLKYFSVFLFLFVALIIWASMRYVADCVVLPNGYLIGYSAIFQNDDDGHPDMILRDITGRILIKTDKSIRFHRHPKNSDLVILEYGKNPRQRLEMPGHEMMPLIFDSDFVGRKWNEKKKKYPNDTSIFWTGFYHVFLKLRSSSKFKTKSCGTPWFED